MHFVVTGANGLVGRRLAALLAARGHRVTALGRGPQRASFVSREEEQRRTGQPAVAWVSVDLGDRALLSQTIETARPDVVLNPGGMTDVDGCEREPDAAYVANVEGVATLCRASRHVGAHLVHVSTDYVFDGDAGPYDVDAVPNPRGHYAVTKHLGEQTVRTLCAPGAWAIARTAVVYGWPATGKNNFGSWLLDTLRQGQPVKLFDDQWVSPTHALNCAEMVAELGERRLSGAWHTAGAEVMDRVAFGRAVCERFGFDRALIQPSKMRDVKLLSPRPARSGLVVTRTAAALSAKPWALTASLDALFTEYKESP